MSNRSESQGKRIKELRLKRGLSHEDLAALVGVSQGAVSQWENGISSPRGKNLKALAEALGVSEAGLFSKEAPALAPARAPSAEELLEVFIRGSDIPQEKKDLLRAIVFAQDEELFGVRSAAAPILKRISGSNKDKLSG